MSISSTRIHTVGLALAIASTSVSAAQLDYGWRVGVGHSDNIGLEQSNPISQNVLIPGFDFSYQQQGSTFQTNVVGNMEYRDYLGNAFDNQKLVELAGQANWSVVPQRLDFTVRDVASVQPLSTFSSNVPNNQQEANVLALGPIIHFRLNPTLRGQTELTYTNSHASKTNEFNSSRGSVAVRLIKDLNSTTSLSTNAEVERVTFDESNNAPNYNRTQLYAGYVSRLSKVEFDASLGWSRLTFNHADNVDSPLARFRIAWHASPRTTLGLRASREYADAAQDLLGEMGQNSPVSVPNTPLPSNIGTGNAVISSQIYIERRLEGEYTYTGSLLTLTLAPLYRKLDYVNDSASNQVSRGGTAGLDYRLRPRLTLSAFANTDSRRYESLARTDRVSNFGVVLTNQRTAHWSWSALFTRRLRSSTAAGASYHANEIYLGVAYRR
ncbi:MAG TPA: outer membrane beta-barrel protein [Rhodanobacter sp.]|nr:outer membrane beta-barrel protein [Rhodanobacter sp.]